MELHAMGPLTDTIETSLWGGVCSLPWLTLIHTLSMILRPWLWLTPHRVSLNGPPIALQPSAKRSLPTCGSLSSGPTKTEHCSRGSCLCLLFGLVLWNYKPGTSKCQVMAATCAHSQVYFHEVLNWHHLCQWNTCTFFQWVTPAIPKQELQATGILEELFILHAIQPIHCNHKDAVHDSPSTPATVTSA